LYFSESIFMQMTSYAYLFIKLHAYEKGTMQLCSICCYLC